MKRLLQLVQILGVIVFTALALYANLGQEHLKEYARDYINQVIEPKVTASVGFASELLESPKVKEFLAPHQKSIIEAEITTYLADPTLYIQKITDDEVTGAVPTTIEDNRINPLMKGLLEKVTSWKKSVEKYFNETFADIIFDLTLFSISNILAFGTALWLLNREGMIDLISYRVASGILTCSVIYASVMYFDQNWFFTVLLKSYFGWGYPIMIIAVFMWLLYRYEEIKKMNNSNQSLLDNA